MPRQSRVDFQVKKRRSVKNNENKINDNGCEAPSKRQKLQDVSPLSAEIAASPLQNAKRVLHTGIPAKLVGREKEISDISNFLAEHLNQKQPGSLYISGSPGTGKTSCLIHALRSVKADFRSVFINCMSLTTAAGVYRKIANELGLGLKAGSKNINELERSIITQNCVLILDEIDQLDNKGQEVLYRLFEWPQLPNSSVVLIGIANALDMTDRILPRLHVFKYQPTLMHFQPYSREQIIAILEDRFTHVENGADTVIKPIALQLCARKIAASTGDIRKALEVCRRAIEVVENQTKQESVLHHTSDDRCNMGSPRKSVPASSATVVGLQHVNKVLLQVYGSCIQSSSMMSESFTVPLQQKILLCTLYLMVKHCKSSDLTLGCLYEVYRRVCKKRQVFEVDEGEFQSLCKLIEARGFVELKNHKVARLGRFVLKIDVNEIQHVLQDQTLLSSILCDKSVVQKRC